jgi:2-polyprenyl-3-methyl-5-hydroxy-6-metoxy-1,4-benzoquinol methylase
VIDKTSLKNGLRKLGVEPGGLAQEIDRFLIRKAIEEQGLDELVKQLEGIVPDIAGQYSRKWEWNEYWDLKVRGLHAFQCSLMIKALETLPRSGRITLVDIGDSAGTHMLYLRELAKNRVEVDSVSVNVDAKAVERIRARGLQAMLCRAEDLDLMGLKVDLFTSFEMVEHLHNPAIFFRRLAKKTHCNRMLITVPYVKKSRVGLHFLRANYPEKIYAEDEHIFELNPADWTLLLLHSGWKVIDSQIYRQYPRRWPILQRLWAAYWRARDYEGFWGAILEKDTHLSDLYQDWQD